MKKAANKTTKTPVKPAARKPAPVSQAARSVPPKAGSPATAPAAPIEGAEIIVVAEPQLWFESNEPAESTASVGNSGPSPVEVSLWARSPVGIPEPSLLAKFRLEVGHSVLYTATNVVRVEILIERPSATQRLSYGISFRQPARRSAPTQLRLRGNREARVGVTVDAQSSLDCATRVNFEGGSSGPFKTTVDPGVYATMNRQALGVELNSDETARTYPRRDMTFHSI